MLFLGACKLDDSPIATDPLPAMTDPPPTAGSTGGAAGDGMSQGDKGQDNTSTGTAGSDNSAAGSGASGGGGGSSDPGNTPAVPSQDGACANADETVRCYDGPKDTNGVGACRAGEQTCQNGAWSACGGQVEPSEEICDAVDNDCDGEVDEDLTLGSCSPEGGDESLAQCSTYRLACIDGAATCAPTDETPAEQCDGKDDDCDGEVDEDADTSCYTYLGAGEPGCQRVNGTYQCRGVCKPGTRTCVDGRLTGTCEGQITQRIGEVCGESPAVDDNCDGAVDEGCPCEPGATQTCYTGPAGTRGVGRCADGVQTCRSLLGYTSWGLCLNETAPVLEMCETLGQDDDCDGNSNDTDVAGGTCLTRERGICAFGVARCEGDVTKCERSLDPRAEACNGADDDCDGATDEDYYLDSNRDHCGSCTNRCRSNQDCCEGGCVDINNDAQNCGGCGRRCASGETCSNGRCDCTGGSSYCNGACVSAGWFSNNNNHCGRCNNRCPADNVCMGETCQVP